MSRASERRNATCLCSANHRPPVLEYDEHHIWPTYLGGPDVAANRIWLCPTAHSNVHELLGLMLKAQRTYTNPELSALLPRPVNPYAGYVARLGYQRYMDSIGVKV